MEHDESPAPTALLHKLTSYIPGREWDVPVDDPRVRQDIVSCDRERRPTQVKSYATELPRTPLPRELPVGREPALAVLAGAVGAPSGQAASADGNESQNASPSRTGYASEPVDLAGLARILFLSAGDDSAGYAPRLFTEFPDAGVAELVGVDRVHEWPLAVIGLGDGGPAITATGRAVAGLADPTSTEFPLVTAAQNAGDCDRLGEPWDFGAIPAQQEAGKSTTLDQVIIKRGSQRRMDPTRGLPLETLRTSMILALRGLDLHGIRLPHWIAVHDVTGLAPGLYRWPHLDKPIRAHSSDELRAELYRVCLDQSLARDAAFVVIAATDVATLTDRQYREAQLAAGLVEGRLHLAAYALGASATGMTFLDSEIPALLEDPESPHGLIFTCIGVPGNTSRPGGLPGAPTEIRPVTPRE